MITRHVAFHRCGRGQYRGPAPSGRIYWITRAYATGSIWRLKMAENEDAHEGEVIEEGTLNACRLAARRHEAALLAEAAAASTPPLKTHDSPLPGER